MIYSKVRKALEKLYTKLSSFVTNKLLTGVRQCEIFEESGIGMLPSLHEETSCSDIIWIESTDVYQPTEAEYTLFTHKHALPPFFSSVYISEIAIGSLLHHLKSSMLIEQGGILFGNAYKDPQFGIYVEIVDAIAAPATIATETSFQLTSDSWDGILKDAKKLSSKTTIMGWYHSHPNLGVFMSATDMKTQQAFFSHPWCISIVCDPVRKEIGYFQGSQAHSVNPLIFCSWLRR
ncbi:Mov34/MPN/PAD-1 family protein [Trichocoleus sp. FACHB-262]|uniref:Mov34/MPN/PAD-1 family protein n=1 Tax=Trichocoleus sp. FACHB-262 TaxID=2692869 RepID=UPI001685C3E1|nr:Mov34/MPN/PAD-1 family protein [Trichocoleus sp. FACHB-262]MBD2122214.1 Mov34/MPN/PAD-1 family protein [Trichocoleus sp. FACHB-262]